MKSRSMRAPCLVLIAALLAAATIPACAYFNTLYNARRIYREAEKMEGQDAKSRELREKYQEVVKKCAQMIRDFPKSRWVDDAVFLMGQALYRQGEYDKAIRQFQEIRADFPEGDYAARALYWLGLSYYMKQEYVQALTETDRFIKDYPEHELRYDGLFLGGDIKRATEDYDGALAYYGRVADEAKKREIVDEARLKSAELFRAREDWEKAAASYEKVLRKGISSRKRYEVSLALGDCYTKMGKCREGLALFDELRGRTTIAQDIPPILLGSAASYACMDSLERSLAVYDEVITKFPRSKFSAEALYRKGIIYHERLDSLRLAQEAFGKVGGEYANSEFAAVSLERGSSIKRLLELEKSAITGETTDLPAERLFLSAEIQLTRLGDIPLALKGYSSVLDSFPSSSFAPKAAYAIAWIHQHKLAEKDGAIERYRALIRRYPRSYQAKGALSQLASLGADELVGPLQAYVDSALADTTGTRESATVSPAPPDTVPAAVRDTIPLPPDAMRRRGIEPRRFPPDTSRMRRGASPMVPDTSRARRPAPPAAPDTSGSRTRGGA